ncbi:retrovirus-related pol polyprotein from transposon TNT 1-94 [Tanacetum coccineum]
MSDNEFEPRPRQVMESNGKLLANVGYHGGSTGKKVALGKLNCLLPPGRLNIKIGEQKIQTLHTLSDLQMQVVQVNGDSGDLHQSILLEGLWTQSILFKWGNLCDLILEVAFEKQFLLILILMLVHDKKPDLTFLRVFGALCYPTNDSEDLGKFQAKADIGIFVGYAPSRRKGYRIYNKKLRRLMETIHVTFDEMHQTMAPVRISSGPEPIMMTPGQLNSGLAPSPIPATTYIPPTDKDLEILFQPMFDEYFDQSTDSEPVPTATVVNAPINCPKVEPKNSQMDLCTDRASEYSLSQCCKNQESDHLSQIGMSKLFSECDLQEEVFFSQPEGFEDQDNPTHRIILLEDRSLLGLNRHQMACMYTLSKFLLANNFFKECRGSNEMSSTYSDVNGGTNVVYLSTTSSQSQRYLFNQGKNVSRNPKEILEWISRSVDTPIVDRLGTVYEDLILIADAIMRGCQDSRIILEEGWLQFLEDKIGSTVIQRRKEARLSSQQRRNT